MIPFFEVYLRHWPTNENIYFSKFDGSDTPVVILDDGWSPAITTYVQDGEKTWSDVVEEIDCMTNVATRDEALVLIEKINALVHKAARDIEEIQAYTLFFHVRSQFSAAPENAVTPVLSPPDDGRVINLSSDIQIAPPGQIRFKLRFKRAGEWITTDTYTTNQFYLESVNLGYRGVWVGSTSLTAPIHIPTPITTRLFAIIPVGGINCKIENLFVCNNVQQHYIIKNFIAPTGFNIQQINYSDALLAQDNKGYLIKSNAVYYSYNPGPYSDIFIPRGSYAVFVSWRAVQANVPHALKLRFSNAEETNYTLLLAKDTHPKLTFLGTITLRTNSGRIYLLPKIGHSTGFEVEKIVFIQLKPTSSILQIKGLLGEFFIEPYESILIQNDTILPNKRFGITVANNQNTIKTLLRTYDSFNIVADNQNISIVVLGHSPEVFSLRVYNNYTHMNAWDTTITYRSIRTTLQ